MNTRKEPGPMWQIGRPVLWGVAVGGLVGSLLLLLMAAAMTVWDAPQAAVVPLATAAAAVAALIGGFTAAKIARRQGLLLGAICGALLYVLIWLSGLAHAGEMQAASILIKWAILTACGAVGGILGVNFRRRPHR